MDKLLKSIDIPTEYRIINISGAKLYIEGVKALGYLSSESIQLKLKAKSISIKGERLKINYLDKSSCIIEGKILVVEEA